MLKNELMKFVDILQSAGNEVKSFAETSSETYSDIIEFNIQFGNYPENIVRIAEGFASIGYEIILLDRTIYPKTVIQIIPLGSLPR